MAAISSSSPDIAIIGGGIVGLWCARLASLAGAAVTLIEADRIGAGASGGMLGALMPHQPTGWNEKKQFQLDGLLSLPGQIAELEDETGLDCGYHRCGRLMPIGHAEKRRQSAQWAEGTVTHWPEGVDWTVREANPAPGWLADDTLPHGCNHDTLSARIDPRAYVAALRDALEAEPRVTIRQGVQITNLDDVSGLAGTMIVAAGVGSFPLLDPDEPTHIGRPVKGQGALIKPARPVDPAAPILYDAGVYVIAHAKGLVAVGSTSENVFHAPDTTDHRLDDLIARAKMLCPALEGGAIVERWAGLRPRAVGREPLVGPMPGRAGVIVATGGFKITFAIAHLMAEAAVAFAMGGAPENLPEMFLPERRLEHRRHPGT